MPFTLSHPAIVLPLLFRTRRWLSITGLVLGSMAPDFEYFLRLKPFGYYGHTWVGLFWFDLPMGLLIAGLFHGVVKRPLVRSLPLLLRARLGQLSEEPWPLRNLWSGRLILGILAGSLSHIFWDAFTHNNSPVSVGIDFLNQQVGPLTLYRWLQYVFSVIGLLAMAWFVWKLPVQPRLVKATSKIQRLFWTFTGALTAIFWLTFMLIHDTYSRSLLTYLIVTGISAISLALLITSTLMRRYFQPSKQARAARALKRKIAHELAQKQPQL
ncbi:hypothetical protein GCM10011375_02760 [Hymenobacter qilianensis]|uniref:DUF4184 family protein n=2 Tax=Hymenobacter qilianensis TaxID=1385715 RepID=A0A7H0GR77_9BACT|nr:DUF4184 family protein [Hymenobacter qilianensis]QNP50793.1 DUF4184 family protein [Hymenobacter qilianensis]GGF50684.1 hypothetical protein GCM10011375_02760 [Hymenobacter qilianensis]